MAKNTIQAMPMISFDSALMQATYTLVTPATGLTQALSILKFINNSDQDITISYDGSTDHDFIALGETYALPLQSNAIPNAQVALLPRGTRIYAKGTAGTGDLLIAGYYTPTT